MAKLRLLPRGLSSRAILLTFSTMILVHVTLVIIYAQYNRNVQWQNTKNKLIEQVINTIHMVQMTPIKDRPAMIASLKYPQLDISISDEPLWDNRVNNITFWHLDRLLRGKIRHTYASFRLKSGRWLNFNAQRQDHHLYMQIVLVILELIVGSAVLIAAWSVERFTGPLRNFKRAAERLGVEVNPPPLVEYGPSIVRETAFAMNKMQERIQELLRDRTQMLAAISHDLRTPITRLKLRAQFVTDQEQYEKIVADLDDMESMISQILSYARDTCSDEQKVKLDLASMLQTLCDDAQDIGGDVSVTGLDKRMVIEGQRIALKRAFTNLINNAVKYGNRVHVSVSKVEKSYHILIEDEGPGIPEDELSKVFAPFYRVDQARSSETGGTGLGMAVAYEIIRAHNGTITLNNRQQGGLSVQVVL